MSFLRRCLVPSVSSVATAFLVVGILFSIPTSAQVAGGTILGTVTDASGAVVANATVSIRNTATNDERVASTNKDGFYSAPNLVPGAYEVTASAPGLSKQKTELTLTVGAQQPVNFALQVGQVKETVVVVSDAAVLVDTATSTLRSVVNATTVRELPLNARDWTQLATLQPGVDMLHTQPGVSAGPDRGNRGYGAQLTISGGRPSQNNYRLDGVSINDYSNSAPGSVLGVSLGVDAVEEFSVLTSNYSAEYGRTSGGVINAITRSGANAFHGDAYEFLRNSALDGRNYFDFLPDGITPHKSPFKRNQFGVAGGGPVWKDHTFFFGDYEGVRQGLSITTPVNVPSAAARSGQLGPVDPAVIPFLGFYPAPSNQVDSSGFIATNDVTVAQVTNENYFTTRIDHKFSQSDSLAGTYVFDTAFVNQPDPLNILLTGNRTRRQIFTLQETRLFTVNLLNSVRFGFNRVFAENGQNATAVNPLAKDQSLFTVPGRTAAQITIGGLTPITGGVGANSTYRFGWNSFQLYDDAFLTEGKHSLKFGASFERILDNETALSNPNGVFTFNSIQDFLGNTPLALDAALPGTLSPRNIRQNVFGLYIQDDIRLTRNLTVNAGLRYEVASVPTEIHGKFSTLRIMTDALEHRGSPLFANPTWHNFEPRIGFAWDPRGDGKTSVRSGFGIFDVLPLPYEYELMVPLSAPFFQLGNTSNLGQLPQGSFPKQAFKLLGPHSLRQSFLQPNPGRNYVTTWNLNVQRQIGNDLSALVAYVGSSGVHNPFRADDVNIVLPIGNAPLGPIWPAPQASGTVLNPNWGQISGLMWVGKSSYHALQTQLSKRMSHGLQAQASYTFGKSIDDGSASIGGDTFANSVSSLPWFNPKLRRGPSDFSIKHTLVLNYTWNLPSPKSLPGIVNWFANGWELGGIYNLSSGTPFTVLIGGDPLGLNSTDPTDVPDRLSGPGCSSLVNPGNVTNYVKPQCFAFPAYPQNGNPRRGNLGRNSLTGPRLQNFDVSFFKNNPIKSISETFNIQFRMEIFNLANHANLSPPLDFLQIFDGSCNANGAGICQGSPLSASIDSTATPSRQIQFALKVNW